MLTPACNNRLANLCGELDGNIRHIADALSVSISHRGGRFVLRGARARAAASAIESLYERADSPFDENDIRRHLAQCLAGDAPAPAPPPSAAARAAGFASRNAAQAEFWQKIAAHPVTLCEGPAGTGKTHIALAAALHLLQRGEVAKIILTRPAVEAGGERLGFLPGDMEQKVNPYLRPMFDILRFLLGKNEAERRMAKGEVEIIPLAFMRGVTIRNAALVLDEAQNTLPAQIKMILTRLGEDAKIVIIGDTTQSDLPPAAKRSGLADAAARLQGLAGVAHHAFAAADIVRHPLTRDILRRYEKP